MKRALMLSQDMPKRAAILLACSAALVFSMPAPAQDSRACQAARQAGRYPPGCPQPQVRRSDRRPSTSTDQRTGAGSRTGTRATSPSPQLTQVGDPRGLAKLRRVWGVSLQWVDMSESPAQYGRARAFNRGGYIHISGEHRSPSTGAWASIDGDVIFINNERLILRGTISISNHPPGQPSCTRSGDFTFVEYGYGRRYWRLEGRVCAERNVLDDLDIYY